MNSLVSVILKEFPDARLSCRECGGTDIKAHELSEIGINNPLGERMLSISCAQCGLSDQVIKAGDVRSTVKAWLIQDVRLYTCSFEHKNLECMTESDKFTHFVEGFWINTAGKVTIGDDRVIWIPPGRINHIEIKRQLVRLSE